MDYSSVTEEDLRAKIQALSDERKELSWRRSRALLEMSNIHRELAHRRVGTTDDRVEWQEVGLR